MPKNSTNLFVIALISLTASACSSLEIKDRLLWGDKGKFGATGVHTIHKELGNPVLSKKEWDLKRIGMVCGDADALADLLNIIDKLCARHEGECQYETIAQVKDAIARTRAAAKLHRDLSFFRVDPAVNDARCDFGVLDSREFEIAHWVGPDEEVFEHHEFEGTRLEPDAFQLTN